MTHNQFLDSKLKDIKKLTSQIGENVDDLLNNNNRTRIQLTLDSILKATKDIQMDNESIRNTIKLIENQGFDWNDDMNEKPKF